MIQSADFDISAWSHLVDMVVEPPQPQDPIEALKAAQSGRTPPTLRVPLVFTGIYGGPHHLTIEVLDREPDTVAPGWEDVAEVSLVIPEGKVYFNQPTGAETREVGFMSAAEAGSYRARLHAVGRDLDYDIVVEESKERHLVQFWKARLRPRSSCLALLPRESLCRGLSLCGKATSDRSRDTQKDPQRIPGVLLCAGRGC